MIDFNNKQGFYLTICIRWRRWYCPYNIIYAYLAHVSRWLERFLTKSTRLTTGCSINIVPRNDIEFQGLLLQFIISFGLIFMDFVGTIAQDFKTSTKYKLTIHAFPCPEMISTKYNFIKILKSWPSIKLCPMNCMIPQYEFYC